MILPRQPVQGPPEGVDMSKGREVGNPVVDLLSGEFQVFPTVLPEPVKVHALSDVPIQVYVGPWVSVFEEHGRSTERTGHYWKTR